MRESLRKEIETEYEAQRASNHAEEDARLRHATEADPVIGKLVAERARLFQNGAREAISRPKDAQYISEVLTTRISDIQTELRMRLADVGLATDYLQPVYQCADCKDTGYVGDPIRERCACFHRRVRAHAAKQHGHGLNPHETFETYDEFVYPDIPLAPGNPDSQRSFMARLRTLCLGYAAEFPNNPRRNLLFFGTSGLGKTFLLNSVGNEIRQRGGEVLKVTAYQLVERMRASVFDRDPAAFSVLLETPVLLLDDLGVEPQYTNISFEHLFTLFNERQLAGLHTVISTNLSLNELEKRYNERICSRLFDARNTIIVEFKGQDVRFRR